MSDIPFELLPNVLCDEESNVTVLEYGPISFPSELIIVTSTLLNPMLLLEESKI
jgi:hypothetical protein